MTRHHKHSSNKSTKHRSGYSTSSTKYGVWVAQPTSFDAQTPQQDPKSPHLILTFANGTADINVKSTGDGDANLVYWYNKAFTHPITKSLEVLPVGLQEIPTPSSSDISLDFQRTTPALLDLTKGTIVVADETGANPKTDILGILEPLLNEAISQNAKVYLFGQYYNDSDGDSGIHDIHMNQGNTGDYSNAVYQDGSFMVQFSDHWEAMFLAFATQELPTDNEGDPESDAKPFDETLAAPASSSTS